MYSMTLTDGTVLSSLTRAKNGAFWLEGQSFPSDILTDSNLAFVTIEHDGEFDDVLLDYTLQDIYVSGGWISFRLVPQKKYIDEENYRKNKENQKKREKLLLYRTDKEMRKKGW